MNKQVYHIGFGVDANYAKYAGVLMTNIVLQHLGQPLCFHLACDGLDAQDRVRMQTFATLYRHVEVCIYDVQHRLDNLKPISSSAPPRLNRAVLLRILLPSLVPADVERLLYMDVDMLCLRRMDELWQLDLGNTAVAATMDKLHILRARNIKLQHQRYLAAGLLLFNMSIWRSQHLTEQILDCYQRNAAWLQMLEQDAINLVINGKFTELDDKFNQLIEVNNPLNVKINATDVAIHFVNETKAWTKGCIPEIYELYWRYVRRSLWDDLQPIEPTTVKAAFLAGVTAELHGDYKEATKYFYAVARRLTEHYLAENRAQLFEENL